MRVSVVHNAVSDDGPADQLDVLIQVDAVRQSLRALGHEAFTLPAGLDLGGQHVAHGYRDVIS